MNKMKKGGSGIAAILLLALALMPATFARNPLSGIGPADEWMRIQSASGDFSIAMPQGAFVAFDAEGFGRSDPQDWKRSIHYTDIRSASIFQGGLAMYVERFKVSDTAKGLAFLMPQRHEGEV